MAIGFNEIGALRVPFVGVEFNASRATSGAGALPHKGLIIAQKTSAGTGTEGVPYLVSNADAVRVLGGVGSKAHVMAIDYFLANPGVPETYVVLLDDDGDATAAVGAFTFTGTATETREFAAYIGGRRVSITIEVGDTATEVGDKLEAAITAETVLEVTAANTAGAVATTAKNAGALGNTIPLQHSYQPGEGVAAGITVAITGMATGATDPDVSVALAGLTGEWFTVWAHPFTDATNLTAIEDDLVARAHAYSSQDALAIGAANGTLSSLVSLGSGRNVQFSVILGPDGENAPVSPWRRAASAAAQAIVYGALDPARPFQTLPLRGLLPSKPEDRFTLTERDTLLKNGIATTKAVAGGRVTLDRLITTYQTNAAGAPDTAYLDATTVLTLQFARWSFINRFLLKYPRHKLAQDGTPVAPGSPILTPSGGRAEALSWFLELQNDRGLFEGYEQFKRDLVVEINSGDPNRLDFLLPPDLINQLIVTAAKLSFGL